MPSEISVGVMGLGIMGTGHLDNLVKMPDVSVTALWDINHTRASDFAGRVGKQCRPFEDYHDLIEHAGVDALFIAIPPHTHTDHEILAAQRGIPFLMEKPVHRSLVQALEIERRIDETGVLHAAGFHNRYLPQAIVARDAIGDTTVGLVMGFAFWSQPGGHNLTSYHGWLFNRDLGGGQIFEHTTHIFDLCRYFVGEVRSVYCRQATRLDHSNIPGYSSADVDAVVLEFENGVVGLVGDGHVTPTSYWWGLRVMTDQGIFEYDANSLRTIRQERAEEYQPDLPDGIHMPQDATFIEAVRTGDRSLIRSDYRNGIKNMAVSLAALESADCGQPVEVAAVLESAERASR